MDAIALQADMLLRSALRGEQPGWPRAAGPELSALLQSRAALHGVHSLLHERRLPWPPPVLQSIREAAIANAMWELRHQQLLDEVLSELHRHGVRPVLIKGSALAYSLYPEPALRARGDTDLVIAPGDRAVTHDALELLGFERQASSAGDFSSHQASYVREGHTLDVHWRINNSELLSRLFTHGELLAEAVPIPSLANHAMGPGIVHSMLLACMHRATHRTNPYYVQGDEHHEPDRLIWLYDIHLLASRLTEAQWHECIALARAKGLLDACREGLEHAHAAFGTEWPGTVQQALNARGAERASTYLRAGALRQQWMDFRALRSWRERGGWLRERFFPPADYMRRKYGSARVRWLPWLYLRRAAAGLIKRAQH